MSTRKSGRENGFALIEVMISITILAVGLLGLAALMASLTGTTTQSRYLGTEVMLASEKLEDLNQLTTVPVGGSVDPAKPDPCCNDIVRMSSDNGGVDGRIDDNMDGVALTGTLDKTLLSFQRLWIVEAGVAGLGKTKRITVLVVPLTGTALERAATFQTSAVRQ